MSENLTSKTLHGLKWSYASTIINAVLQLVFTAILARLLPPSAFGLVAMALVVLRFGGYFSQMGVGPGLVQKKQISDEDIAATFTSSVLLGLVVALAIWLLAPLAQFLFDTSDVVDILKVMAVSIFLTGVSTTSQSLLRRKMQFRSLAVIETSSYLLGYGGIGLLMAFNGFGVWSLVCGSIAQNAIYAGLAYATERHGIAMTFRWKHFAELFHFGSRFSLVSFVEYISVSLDTFLVGRFSGASRLGFYNRGYMIVYLPMSYLASTFSRVLFASYSRIQVDTDRLKSAYLSSITLSAALVIPGCTAILVCAKDIVSVLLGPAWLEVVPLLRIFSIGVMALMLSQLGGIICDSTGRLTPKLVIQVSYVCVLAGLLYIAKPFGIIGFATAVAFGELLREAGFAFLMRRILGVGYREFFSSCMPGIVNASIVVGALVPISVTLPAVSQQAWVNASVEFAVAFVLLFTLTFRIPMKRLKIEIVSIVSRSEMKESELRIVRWVLQIKPQELEVQAVGTSLKGRPD